MNGIAIDPRPVLREPIFQCCLYLLVWIQSSPTSFCLFSAHGLQNCACGDVDIWSGDEERRFPWRNGRGIRERREGGGNMGKEMCEKVCEKVCEKMCEKMGERYVRR